MNNFHVEEVESRCEHERSAYSTYADNDLRYGLAHTPLLIHTVPLDEIESGY
ncbi:MAG TPA: hypothetical protein VNS63_24590 [Blastocatellia bacterium]|nr:hypothetical protein [Blastocatellia bacterium]